MSVVHGNRRKPSSDSIREGSVVHIKSREWYNENKRKDGSIECGVEWFVEEMCQFLDMDATVNMVNTGKKSKFKINGSTFWFTPEMVEYVVKY